MKVAFHEAVLKPQTAIQHGEAPLLSAASALESAANSSANVSHNEGSQSDGSGVEGRSRPKSTKKALAALQKTWMRIAADGQTTVIHADKYKITHKLGVQPRDLRLLDTPPLPGQTNPAAILGRENAILVNLENIKAIIATDYVLVVDPEHEKSAELIIELKSKLASSAHSGKVVSYAGLSRLSDVTRKLQIGAGSVELPFELKALEICLDMLVGQLDNATQQLEQAALPILDSLARRVRMSDLEQTRRIKSRLVRLKTRVESIHEVLEKFLDDDQDMYKLNLTAKELSRQASEEDAQLAAEAPAEPMSRRTSSSLDSQDEAEVAEVEMLLEAYDMHLENTLHRLQTLDEYIKDTEDLINTGLDQKRNELITTDLILQANIVALGLITAITGVLAMNLVPSYLQVAPDAFNLVTIATCCGTYVVLGSFVLWAWKENLLIF